MEAFLAHAPYVLKVFSKTPVTRVAGVFLIRIWGLEATPGIEPG
jgi:hypothetical protein